MIGRLADLYVRMLRYRAALMIWMFLLLGAAYAGGLENFDLDHFWALTALASSYVCATTINDLADEAIDRVNHPGDEGRPLITGRATRRDLFALNAIAALLSLAAAAFIGGPAIILVVVGLIVAYSYSAPPVRLSYRTHLAPVVLSLGYVVVPYGLGVVVADGSLTSGGVWLLGGLTAFFIARINLKDFRDRVGDAMHDRPTLLLRHGKDVTCTVSLVALILGDIMLLYALRPPLVFAVVIQLFVATMVVLLRRLRTSSDVHEEQLMIGIGARAGNGLLLLVLSWLLLEERGAPLEHGIALAVVVTAAYGLNLIVLLSRPQEVVIGYKG